jgi:hypothetical protein
MRPVPALLGAALLASLLPAPGALHAQDPGQELALVQQIRLAGGGQGLFAERTGVEELLALDMGDLLNDGDGAYTREGTRAVIRSSDDQALVRMDENTVLRIRAEGEDRGSLRRIIELEGGELWARITGRPGTETHGEDLRGVGRPGEGSAPGDPGPRGALPGVPGRSSRPGLGRGLYHD